MISKWVIVLFLAFTVCEFCGKDFESLNRHKWKCKSITTANNNASSNNIVNPEIINNRSISSVEYISCSCGKRCKGLCGLKTHQRSCKAVK